mmetsp:Transcript_64399/g.119747  ORF Transcript_64399/g.119747 Transcript_64399/m.119747 type:complete len:192 (-) Transcript_64399:22-597(-)
MPVRRMHRTGCPSISIAVVISLYSATAASLELRHGDSTQERQAESRQRALAPSPPPGAAAASITATSCVRTPSACTCPEVRQACAVASRDCEAQVKALGGTAKQAHIDNYLSKFDHPLLNTMLQLDVTEGSNANSVSCTVDEQKEMADCMFFLGSCEKTKQSMVLALRDTQRDTEWMDKHPLTPPGMFTYP